MATELHTDYQTGEITEIEVPDYVDVESDLIPSIIVDSVEYFGDTVTGYLNGDIVIHQTGITDTSLIELFDISGNKVKPIFNPPEMIKAKLAIVETIELMLLLLGTGVATDSVREEISTNGNLGSIWEMTPIYAIVGLYVDMYNCGLRNLDQIHELFRADVAALINKG